MREVKKDFHTKLGLDTSMSKAEGKILSKYWEWGEDEFKYSINAILGLKKMDEETILRNSFMVLYFDCIKCDCQYNLIARTRNEFQEMITANNRICHSCLSEMVKSYEILKEEHFKKPSKKHSRINIEAKEITLSNTSKISINFSDIISYKLVK